MASRYFSEGDPYKRLKLALSAVSKAWTLEIDDDGDIFDCTPEGIRMEQSLLAAVRSHIYLSTSTAILQKASGKDVVVSSDR